MMVALSTGKAAICTAVLLALIPKVTRICVVMFGEIWDVDRTAELVVVALTTIGTRVEVVAFREVSGIDKMIELAVVFRSVMTGSVDIILTKG